MSAELRRHERQSCLPEVGLAGQARLARGSVELRAGAGAVVAMDYLCRAGVGRASIACDVRPEAAPWPHHSVFVHAAAADLARGAWLALREIRRLLQGEEASP